MYVNHVGRDITISLDSQEEAAAVFAVLTGTPTTERAHAFGAYVYGFFFEAVRKLATQFDKENEGIRPVARKPGKGVLRSGV